MDDFKNILINKIDNILNLDDEKWNNLEKHIKLKYIHRICNLLENDNIENKNNILIPLKSIKPKKLIQFCGYSNIFNKNLYSQFNQSILNYTFDFRNKYINVKNRIYYSYSSLPQYDYNKILNDLNEIVFTFMNKNKFNANFFLKSIIGNNFNKIINSPDTKQNYILKYKDNILEFFIDNIEITMNLNFTNNQITNNIPVKYYVNLNNQL